MKVCSTFLRTSVSPTIFLTHRVKPAGPGHTPLMHGIVEPFQMGEHQMGTPAFASASKFPPSNNNVSQTNIETVPSSSKRAPRTVLTYPSPNVAATAAPGSSSGAETATGSSIAELKQRQTEVVAAREPDIVQHQDSGIRQGQTVELPPTYSAD